MAPLPPEEHLVKWAGLPSDCCAHTSMTTRTETQSYPLPVQGPSLPELAGLVAFIAILLGGLLGLLHYVI